MIENKDTAQCKSLSTKNERCRNEEGHQGLHRSVRGTEWVVISRANEASCIETYPASDGLDRCMYQEGHPGLHLDDFRRSWSTETVTTISQEQPEPHGIGQEDRDDEEFDGDYIPDDYA